MGSRNNEDAANGTNVIDDLLCDIAGEIMEVCFQKRVDRGNFSREISFSLDDIISAAVNKIFEACKLSITSDGIKKNSQCANDMNESYAKTGSTFSRLEAAGAQPFAKDNCRPPQSKVCCNAGRGKPWNYQSFSEPSKENCSWCKQVSAPVPTYYPRNQPCPPSRPQPRPQVCPQPRPQQGPQLRPQPRPQACPQSPFQGAAPVPTYYPRYQQCPQTRPQPSAQQCPQPRPQANAQQCPQPRPQPRPRVSAQPRPQSCPQKNMAQNSAFRGLQAAGAAPKLCCNEGRGKPWNYMSFSEPSKDNCSWCKQVAAPVPSYYPRRPQRPQPRSQACPQMQGPMYGPMLPDRFVPEIPGLPKCEDEVINRFNEGLQALMDEEEQNKVCEEMETTEVYEPYRPTTCQDEVNARRQGVTDRFNEGLYSLMEQEIEDKGCEEMPQMEEQMDAEMEAPQNYEPFAMTTCKDQLAAVRQGLTDNFNQGLHSLMEQENQNNACQEPPQVQPSPEICEPDMYKYSCRNDAMARRQACSNRFHEGLQQLIEKEERAKACMPTPPVQPEPPPQIWKPQHILTRRDMDINVRNDFMRGPTMEERQEMMKYTSAPPGKRAASDIAYQQRFQRRMTNQLDLITQGMDNLTRNRFKKPCKPKPCKPKPCPQACPPSFQWPKIDSNIENLEDITLDLVGSSGDENSMCE